MKNLKPIRPISTLFDVCNVERDSFGNVIYYINDRKAGAAYKLVPIDFPESWSSGTNNSPKFIDYCSSLCSPFLAKYLGWFEDTEQHLTYVKLAVHSEPALSSLLSKPHLFTEEFIWSIARNIVDTLMYLHRHGLLVWVGLNPSSLRLTDETTVIFEDYFSSFRFWTYVFNYTNPYLAPEFSSLFRCISKQNQSFSAKDSIYQSYHIDEQYYSTIISEQSMSMLYVSSQCMMVLEGTETSSSVTKDDLVTSSISKIFDGSSVNAGLGAMPDKVPLSSIQTTLHDTPQSMDVLRASASSSPEMLTRSFAITSCEIDSQNSKQNLSNLPQIQNILALTGLSALTQRKADVWSIGALLLSLCLGRQLVPGDNCIELVRDLCKKAKSGNCLYSQSLCMLIRSCLCVDSKKRPGISILSERIQIHLAPRLSLPTSLRGSMSNLYLSIDDELGCVPQSIITSPSGSMDDMKMLNYGRPIRLKKDDHPLIKAADAGDPELVRANINYLKRPGFLGRTALMYAAANGRVECIKLLLAETRCQDQLGFTALMYAVKNNQLESIRLLVKDEAGMQDSRGFTALMYAAAGNSKEAVSILIKKAGGKELKKHNMMGETALMLSMQHWNSEIADYLIKEARLSNVDGCTALMYAAKIGNLAYVKLLAPKEAGMRTLSGDRALELAIMNANKNCVDILSSYELKSDGDTPLSAAIKTGNKRLMTISTPLYCQDSSAERKNYLLSAIKLRNKQAIREILSFELPNVGVTKEEYLNQALKTGDKDILDLVYMYSVEHELSMYVSPRPKSISTKLMECATNGDVEGIHSHLLELGITDSYGNTALIYAVQNNKYEAAAALICEANIQNLAGWSPLMIAAGNGSVKLVQLLLEHSAGLINLRRETALMIAVKSDHPACAQLLAKVEARRQDINGTTALMLATLLLRPTLVDLLIPFEVGMQDSNGATALMLAAQLGELRFVHLLLAEAALQTNAQCFEGEGWTAMMYAAYEGYADIVSILQKQEHNMQTKIGRTALMIAAFAHRDQCVELLCHEEREAQDENGFTALMYAINSRHNQDNAEEHGQVLRCIQLLLHEIHLCDYSGSTPLILAVNLNRLDVLKLFISNEEGRKQIKQTDSMGMTALMHASLQGYVECVKELLKYYQQDNDAPPESKHCGRDKEGQTALMCAANNGRIICVGMLLPLERNITSNSGFTALMYAARTGYIDVVKKIVAESDELTMESKNGTTALVFAATEGCSQCLRFLYECYIERGISPISKSFTKLMLAACLNDVESVKAGIAANETQIMSSLGFTALMYAAINGSFDSLLLLIPYETRFATDSGLTALMLASKMGYKQCVQALMASEAGLQTIDGWSALMFAAISNNTASIEVLLDSEFALRNVEGKNALDIINIQSNREAWTMLHAHHASLRAKET